MTDPYKGAKKGGATGFFKGLGTGLLGVVAKPASGAVGFASHALTGIGNTAEYLTDSKVHAKKMRPQRFIAAHSGLEPFDQARAEKHEAEEKVRAKLRRKGKLQQTPK